MPVCAHEKSLAPVPVPVNNSSRSSCLSWEPVNVYMWLIMINPQKPVINLIKIFNRFTALLYTYICICEYICIYICMCVYIYMYLLMYLYMYICMYVFMYIYTHIYVCVLIYIYICIYTGTHSSPGAVCKQEDKQGSWNNNNNNDNNNNNNNNNNNFLYRWSQTPRLLRPLLPRLPRARPASQSPPCSPGSLHRTVNTPTPILINAHIDMNT